MEKFKFLGVSFLLVLLFSQSIFANEVAQPLVVGYVGDYCMRNYNYVISNYGVTMEASSSMIRYTSGSRVPYCNLFYD